MVSWIRSRTSSRTPEQEAGFVKELRQRFAAEHEVDDACAWRFLHTRSWDVDAASVMLQESLRWRSANLPVLHDEVADVLSERKIVMLGPGAGGRPVFALNFQKLLGEDWGDQDVLQKHVRAAVYCAEEMVTSMPEGVDTWIAVINCNGIRGPPALFMAELTKVLKGNYPERAHSIVMYPVPHIIAALVQTMMTIIPEKTRNKVCFVSSLEDLCNETGLPVDRLPAELLGTSPDMEVLEGAVAVEVAAGKTGAHSHRLSAGDSVRWEFSVLDHTINFRLRFAADAGTALDGGDAGPTPRGGSANAAGAAYIAEELERAGEGSGNFTAEMDGALEFAFDNEFSYMRGKSIVLSCGPPRELADKGVALPGGCPAVASGSPP